MAPAGEGEKESRAELEALLEEVRAHRSPVSAAWFRIEEWLEKEAPPLRADLPGPATAEAILAAEGRIGARLPRDVRASLLVHDGNGGSKHAGVLAVAELPEGKALAHHLHSLEEMAKAHAMYVAILRGGSWSGLEEEGGGPGVRKGHWRPLWIPISVTPAGNACCLDLDPAPEGTHGQVIGWFASGGPRKPVAPSFADLLGACADALEAGKYRFDGEEEVLVRARGAGAKGKRR